MPSHIRVCDVVEAGRVPASSPSSPVLPRGPRYELAAPYDKKKKTKKTKKSKRPRRAKDQEDATTRSCQNATETVPYTGKPWFRLHMIAGRPALAVCSKVHDTAKQSTA